jgi:hypothetical protein
METNNIEEYFVEIPIWWQRWNADFLEVLNDFFYICMVFLEKAWMGCEMSLFHLSRSIGDSR